MAASLPEMAARRRYGFRASLARLGYFPPRTLRLQ
jgi:hypothetical protein